MSRPIHVLYVDDDPASLQFRSQLLTEFDGIAVSTAGDVSAGLALLEESEIDCVLSDLDMPSGSGLAFLRSVRSRHADLPFILFTSTQSREVIEEALEADATDYIVKRDIDRFQEVLVNRIRQFVAHYRAKQRRDAGDQPETDASAE